MPLFRRNFLQSLLGGGLALGAGAAAAAESTKTESPQGNPFRFAFLTDVHLPAGKPQIAARVARLVDGIQARPTSPSLFAFGGDCVMAVDGGQADDNVTAQFQGWRESVMERLAVPSVTCIGNHDIRWADKSSDQPASYAEKGKAIAAYDMPARYYSVDHGGWTFFSLDTYQRNGCEIDETQWDWFAAELKKSDKPAVVLTHAPLFSVTHFFEPSTDKGLGKGYVVPAGWSPQHLTKVRQLFREHPRVKLCLSGHMHTVDRVEVDNTTYICGGAVSGDWWNSGTYLDCPASWMEVKLYPDGSWAHEHHVWT
ncbi:metallophosphoesterase family protein [Blastopirellula retiformator]|uniref:Calcineurin-like phosphoesterase n=1 Tax=Blastopirellula retiformator TaxID=2527970 RepID=A0A5C5V3C2_9BACT|nr:metallophosphoesterase [Blastopirellula retiformator]TWT32881.1 Calcineurin-like phosphoesterase [Blastopirellula retiformator]